MSEGVRILDSAGRPVEPRPRAVDRLPGRRIGALQGGSHVPLDAADRQSTRMAGWNPYLWSPDGEQNIYRDTVVARIRDLVRNDGWGAAGITRIVDNVVGAKLRPVFTPDWKALQAYTGIKAFDATWASEYRQALTPRYRTWAYDDGKWCELSRQNKFGQHQRIAFRHKMVDGDAIGILHWRPDRVEPGRARYATCVQGLDPDRLSNPQLRFDTNTMRGGVEVDPDDDVAIAYHIRKAHQGDWFSAAKSVTWERILREHPNRPGRPIVVHDYDSERFGTHRGGGGVLKPVLERLRMLARYDSAELDAALINAIFAAFIESPFDQEFAEEAMGEQAKLSAYQEVRSDYWAERPLHLADGVGVTKLFPGEKASMMQATRPAGNFDAFEKAVLRNAAGAMGLAAPQLTNDWSDVNYSSYRGALNEFWKTLGRRRDDFADNYSQPIASAVVEEIHDYGELDDVLPHNAPPFEEFRHAYSHATWLGPPKGMLDLEKELKGLTIGLDAMLLDYDEVCAEFGVDGDEMISRFAELRRRFEKAGAPIPNWLLSAEEREESPREPAQTDAKDPEAA